MQISKRTKQNIVKAFQKLTSPRRARSCGRWRPSVTTCAARNRLRINVSADARAVGARYSCSKGVRSGRVRHVGIRRRKELTVATRNAVTVPKSTWPALGRARI